MIVPWRKECCCPHRVTTIAYRKKGHEEVMEKLPRILRPCEAEILSDRIANHEWKNRFKVTIVKRLGPSRVPSEIVIPWNL